MKKNWKRMKNKTTNFYDKCYEQLKLIPKGKVTTYKEIAKSLNTKAYRAVGSAMAKNKQPIVIPCHRVVKSNGEIGEFVLGVEKKIELLRKEGISITNKKVDDFKECLHTFNDN